MYLYRRPGGLSMSQVTPEHGLEQQGPEAPNRGRRSRLGLLQGVQKSWSGEGGGVTGLNISCVNAGHATGRVLGEILSGGGSLLSLDGSMNKLGCGPSGGGAAEIARGMAAGASLGGGLTSLNLSNNRWECVQWPAFAPRSSRRLTGCDPPSDWRVSALWFAGRISTGNACSDSSSCWPYTLNP